MDVSVRNLLGVGEVPKDRAAAVAWLQRDGVEVRKAHGNGGMHNVVALSDIPAPVRLAYLTRRTEAAGLPVGTYDEAAHDAFADMPLRMRSEAERKAEIARYLAAAGKALTWPRKVAAVAAKFGGKGTSEQSLNRISKAVEGVDPINFAPALLADYGKGGAPKADTSPEAWTFFLTTIQTAGEGYPLRQA